MTDKVYISKEVIYLTDFDAETDKLEETYGTTNLYSTSSSDLDYYLYGGYGRKDGYEIVLLFGDTGIGKSNVALNMIKSPVLGGKRIGLLMLEDDGPDVNMKLRKIFGREVLKKHHTQIIFTTQDIVDGSKLWGLDDLLVLIEFWFVKNNIDILVLDPIQFAFESAIGIRGENEYIAQRIFIRKINYLMRKLKKTIIIITHTGKDKNAKGMARILGSSGMAAGSTKTIEIRKRDGFLFMQLHKTRFTPERDVERAFTFDENHCFGGPNGESL